MRALEVALQHLESAYKTLDQRMREQHQENTSKLDAILQQVTKTNGRVTRLEYWRRWVMGAAAGCGGFGAVLYDLLRK